jgi:nitrate reductase gamma subunit
MGDPPDSGHKGGGEKLSEAMTDMIAQKTNETSRRKKWLLAGTVLISLLWWCSVPADASWWINPKKFHASVHGQTGCQDCHEDTKKQALHPNPEEIGKGAKDFFQPDHCLVCHEEVTADLKKGKHGSQPVQDLEKHKMCLVCHDPHEQAAIKEKVKVDPGKPRHEQCGACHEEKKELPPLSAEDETCMACHRGVRPEESNAVEKIKTTCFHCHAQLGTQAQVLTGKKISLVSPAEYARTPHAKVTCVICHPQATESGHGKNISGDCRQCHLPYHEEKVAHDLHALVACGSCHLQGTKPERDPKSTHVMWKREFKPDQVSRVHGMAIRDKDASCRHCHTPDNRMGAASMILPAKSIICMPCHAGTFSVGDTTTILTLIVFVAGMVMVFSYVLTGASSGERSAGALVNFLGLLGGAIRALFSKKIGAILKALFLDVLLQRRLYRQSPKRWLIHSLIFYPFAIRFVWGIVGLVGSLWKPEWTWVWPVLNKNSPATAVLFDLTGILLVAGLMFAFLRGQKQRSGGLPDLPRQDLLALGLIAGIVVVGFILEGMRIAMTGFPEGSFYAFVGYSIGRLFFSASSLAGVYGYVWYVHAVLTGAFIAYLPFSRLLHIIISPIVLLGNAASRHENVRKGK